MKRVDITIESSSLRLASWLAGLGFVLVLGLIGAVGSPLINGHPVVLTRERLAIKTYLDAAQDWTNRLDDIGHQLAALQPTPMAATLLPTATIRSAPISAKSVPTTTLPTAVPLPPQRPLTAPDRPASQPVGLYDRSHAAEQAVYALQAIDTEMQRLETPPALSGLHALATAALQAEARWSAASLDDIGAPSPDHQATLESEQQAAAAALTAFRAALSQPNEGDTQP